MAVADNASTPKRRYVVYMPDGPEALCVPFHLSEEADVQDLIKEIHRTWRSVKDLTEDEIILLKCGELDMDPRPARFTRISEWVLKNCKTSTMEPSTRLSEYFTSGPAAYEDKKIDIVVVTKSSADLKAFLRTTALPSWTVKPARSSTTHLYNTLGVGTGIGVPCRLIISEDMVSSMIEDLFTRILPDFPIADERKVSDVAAVAQILIDRANGKGLQSEADVRDMTIGVVGICLSCMDAVGLDFELDSELTSAIVNVRMDGVIKRKNASMGPGVAIKNESPKVFAKHCTDAKINVLCQHEPLQLATLENDFRGIFFKLTAYMLQQNFRWGLINGGTRMRIVRIEEKQGQPYAIISGEISTDSLPPYSVYSLICYMLLTCSERATIPIFERIIDPVPAAPRINNPDNSARTRSQTGMMSGNVTCACMMLHIPAAAGRLLVDIPMMRIDKLQTPVRDVHSAAADVRIIDFLDAGSFGRVFLAELFIHNLYYGQVVVKLANANLEKYLDTEARAYAKLRSLYGDGIPRYYGLFSGEDAGIRYWCILIDFCGDPVETTENLPLSQRFEIFRILLMIHRRGVMHNDFSPMNILRTKSGIRLMDFSIAIIYHQCPGMESCPELIDAATELRLTPLHVRFVLLWSLWEDVYHVIMRVQFCVIALVFFAIFVLLHSSR